MRTNKQRMVAKAAWTLFRLEGASASIRSEAAAVSDYLGDNPQLRDSVVESIEDAVHSINYADRVLRNAMSFRSIDDN